MSEAVNEQAPPPSWVPILGEATFDGYVESVDGRTHDDKRIPAWEMLGDDVRTGWIDAGKAAVQRALDLGIVSEPDRPEE